MQLSMCTCMYIHECISSSINHEGSRDKNGFNYFLLQQTEYTFSVMCCYFWYWQTCNWRKKIIFFVLDRATQFRISLQKNLALSERKTKKKGWHELLADKNNSGKDLKVFVGSLRKRELEQIWQQLSVTRPECELSHITLPVYNNTQFLICCASVRFWNTNVVKISEELH